MRMAERRTPPLPPEALAVAPAAWGHCFFSPPLLPSVVPSADPSFPVGALAAMPAVSLLPLPFRFRLIVCLCEFVFRFARIRLRVLVRPLSSRLTFRLRLGLPRFARFPICFSWGGRPFVSGGGASGLLPRGSAFAFRFSRPAVRFASAFVLGVPSASTTVVFGGNCRKSARDAR